MAWATLIVAGLFEVGWAVSLKYTRGFTVFWPSVIFIVSMILSVGLLAVALKTLPVGTGYAVWTGVGAVGTVLVGMIWLGESVDPRRLICIGLILAGIIGLKIVSPH
jgi:quaternary ammonium compound-resistance protein SugE